MTDHITDDFDPDDMLAAEYALGLLTGEDLAQAKTKAATDPDFVRLIFAWEGRLAQMGDLAPGSRRPNR